MLFFTHPHIDHILSLDWIAQSAYKLNKQKLPVYTSKLCWQQVTQNFPQLKKMVEFNELLPGFEADIRAFSSLKVVFYPVYHAESAPGSGMLFFKYSGDRINKKVLFTGDLLCPLLRKEDYEELNRCDVVYTDSNNRYPYPKCNHWSVVKPEHYNEQESSFFKEWFEEKGKNLSWLCRPNIPIEFNKIIHLYFDGFIREQLNEFNLPFTVFDFITMIKAKNVNIVHYSGNEDENYNKLKILNEKELGMWVSKSAQKLGLESKFMVPMVGDEFLWLE